MADSFHQIKIDSIPKFSGEDYLFWKMKMKILIMSLDPKIWLVICGEPIPLSNDNWTHLNSRALLLFFHALDNIKFKSILEFMTAKEIWNILEHIFEGNTFIKNANLKLFLFQFGNFKMIENESIMEMLTRFNYLLNHLQNLGKMFSSNFLARKFLMSLSDKWKQDIIPVKDHIDSSLSDLIELISFLRFHEGVIKLREEKVLSENDSSEEDIRKEKYFSVSDIEEVFEKLHIKADLAADFRKCLIGEYSNSSYGNGKSQAPFSEEEVIEAMYSFEEIEEILSGLKKKIIEDSPNLN